MKAKKSLFLGSLISREVKMSPRISAIHDTKLRLMRQVMKYVDGRKRTDNGE